MPVDRAEVFKVKLLKQHRGPEQALGGFLGAPRHVAHGLAGDPLQHARRRGVQVLVMFVGHHAVKVARDRAHVAVDRPLVVVEHHDQPLGLPGDIVQRLKRDAVGKGGVAGHGDHMLAAAGQIARHGHAQRGRERGARVPRAIGVVRALRAQHKAVQPARLADGLHAIETPGENLVYVGLVAHVEEQLVGRAY